MLSLVATSNRPGQTPFRPFPFVRHSPPPSFLPSPPSRVEVNLGAIEASCAWRRAWPDSLILADTSAPTAAAHALLPSVICGDDALGHPVFCIRVIRAKALAELFDLPLEGRQGFLAQARVLCILCF